MKAWKVYPRNGAATLAERITIALEHYAIHNGGKLPAGIRVNPKDVQEATATIKALGLEVTVQENGGALLGEVWLQVGDKASGTTTPPEDPTAVFEGSGDLENSSLSTGSQLLGQIVPPMCNGAETESLPDVV